MILNLLASLKHFYQLFDRIVEKEHYSEMEAAETIKPIVDAIRYCHGMGIMHRDLKVCIHGKFHNLNLAREFALWLKRFISNY